MGADLPCLVLLGLVACRPAPPPPLPTPPPPEPTEVTEPSQALRPVRWPNVPALLDDGEDRADLRAALDHDLRWLGGRQDDEPFVFGPRTVAAPELRAALERFRGWLDDEPSAAELARRVTADFYLFESVADVLVTGYYVPVIEGCRRQTADCAVPIYGPPSDIITISLGDFREELRGTTLRGRLRGRKLVPYPSRKEIRESRELHGREIAWARDPVDLFFLEIQGSGVLRLADGRELRIGWAGGNGREYHSIGKLLIDQGKVERERMSMQAIRAYLRRHPEEIESVLDYNENVVFFRKLQGESLGSLGAPVTGRRSIATDHRLFPRGALAFLSTEVPGVGPDGTTVAEGPLRRFVLNQDTGGAIRGPDRVDFFWGRGDEAALRAGLMKQPGKLYFLVPR